MLEPRGELTSKQIPRSNLVTVLHADPTLTQLSAAAEKTRVVLVIAAAREVAAAVRKAALCLQFLSERTQCHRFRFDRRLRRDPSRQAG